MKKFKSKYEILRQEIYIIIYGANTFLGRLFDLSLLGVILLSVFLVMFDSMEGIGKKYHDFVYVCEWIITIFLPLNIFFGLFQTKNL